MKTRLVAVAVALSTAGATLAGQGAGSSSPEMERHIAAAKAAAGADHTGLFDRTCSDARSFAAPPAPRGGGAGARGARQGGPPAPPARDTWYAEPVKVFDNLYFVGMTEYSAWAVTTSQGIILIDAISD